MDSRIDRRIVVIGSGLAGVATALALADNGARRVLLLDRECAPGVHASGLNAGMVRTTYDDPVLAKLARASLPALRTSAEMRLCGAVHLSDEAGPRSRPHRHPLLEGARFASASEAPAEGVVDPHELLWNWFRRAREAGVDWQGRTEVTALRFSRGRVTAVECPAETIRASAVIIAAGAWAGRLVPGLPLRPTRRHLFVTSSPVPVSPNWPIVYHGDEFYFRPEGDGLLMSPCDVEDHPASPPACDPAAPDRLAARIATLFPALQDARPRRWWAGLRTLTPDDRPIVGPDPRYENLFWVAGLGGHGVSISAAVGRIAARSVLHDWEHPLLSPRRFLNGAE